MDKATTIKLPPIQIGPETGNGKRRPRSSSIGVKLDTVGSRSAEEVLDQNAYVNLNADWVNAKGAWLIHVVLILVGKIVIDTLPGMTQQLSWTLTNLCYDALSYLMFHHVRGIPFSPSMHNGAYDDLTLWEQIDDGQLNTPAKKWLVSVPVGLFLISTHFTSYDPWIFALNLTATLVVLIAKLPQLHRQRLRLFTDSETASGTSTPISASFSTPDSRRSSITDITDRNFR